MNLTLYFRLILMSIFQRQVIYDKKGGYHNDLMSYNNTLFYCPVVYAKDGFNVSLQIHSGNYCSSENGYREFGHTMEEVEFGFPSEDDVLLHQYSEMYHEEDVDFTSFDTIGKIPVTVLEELFEKHGGIDWDMTIRIEQFTKFTSKS